MRFFYFILSVVSVALRLAVVVAPFACIFFAPSGFDYKAHNASNYTIWAAVWAFVSFFVFFGRAIYADAQAARKNGVSIPVDARSEGNNGRHFDFMTPGTPEYNVFNYGGQLDLVNGPLSNRDD